MEWLFEDYTIVPVNDDEVPKDESKLVKPISQFLCFVSDSIIQTCQRMFVTSDQFKKSDEEIEQELAEIEDGEQIKYFSIKYSPGIIFSGTVPAFDVNFIKPLDNTTNRNSVRDFIMQNEEKYRTTQSIDTDEYNQKIKDMQSKSYDGVIKGREYSFNGDYRSTIKYDIYYYIDDKSTEEKDDDVLVVETIGEIGTKVGENFSRRSYAYGKQETPIVNGSIDGVKIVYESTAKKLQSVIATWYNALRRIALVGLLSVLVYIGIRIVLTSTSAKDKAKYKSMLKDLLIALCILFTLHYIMSITITVVEKINEVLRTSTMAANGEDIMLTTVRNKIANGVTWSQVLSYVVIYAVVAVYIVIFTVQYLKRTVYIAFLTMIAPLITLTYPLDKIKDSKSQAFDMWIKDYIFFMLLQVVHLLIYYILIGSAGNLADQGNWLFTIVVIGFMVPAEKIIKKMFGFEKSKTLGAMAAGATGALVMNALNKISRKRWFKKRSVKS